MVYCISFRYFCSQISRFWILSGFFSLHEMQFLSTWTAVQCVKVWSIEACMQIIACKKIRVLQYFTTCTQSLTNGHGSQDYLMFVASHIRPKNEQHLSESIDSLCAELRLFIHGFYFFANRQFSRTLQQIQNTDYVCFCRKQPISLLAYLITYSCHLITNLKRSIYLSTNVDFLIWPLSPGYFESA